MLFQLLNNNIIGVHVKKNIINKKILSIFFLLFGSSFLSGMSDFGDAVAIVQEIRNETPFPIELFAESSMSQGLDLNASVVPGRIVRLRSKLLAGRPYVRASEIDGALRLVADGDNPNDTRTHFMLQQYRDDEGNASVGLRSCALSSIADSVVVGWQGTGEVYCTNAVIDRADQKWAHWKLYADPNNTARVWLQNSQTFGWLEVGSRFIREKFEADLLKKTKLKEEQTGKEWSDPWVSMSSTPDGTLRIGSPLHRARATSAAEFEIEIVADPSFPKNFQSVFDGLGFSIAAHAEHIVVLGGKGEPYYVTDESKGWQRMSMQNNANIAVAPFTSIAIGEDKTTFAVNFEGLIYKYDWNSSRWIQDSQEEFRMISCSKEDLVWAIGKNKKLYRRMSGRWEQFSDLPNTKPKQVSVGVDGSVWVVGEDQVLYSLEKDSWIVPNYSIKAIAISVADKNNIVALSPDYTPMRALPGKGYEQWTPVNSKFVAIAMTTKSEIVGLGGEVVDSGLKVVKGNLYQDSEIESANSFDMKPYRWPIREDGFMINGSSSMSLGQLGFSVKTGSGTSPGLSFKRTPEIRGYSYMKPDNDFMRGTLLSLGSLHGRGYAWLEKSLTTAGRATLVFRARTKAEGDLQVVMGERVGNECLYRVIFGGDGNTTSVVLKEGESVLENPVSTKYDPRAATLPGAFELFWVSIDNGFIMAGKGLPGENIFMARRDANPPEESNGRSLVRNLGFSSFKSIDPVAVEITEVVTMPPISFIPPMRTFVNDPKVYVLKQSGESEWLEHKLRTPGEGSLYFTIKGNGTIRIRFAVKPIDDINQFNGYEVVLSSQGPIISQIRRIKDGKNTLVSENKKYGITFNAARPLPFWVSCNQGTIAVGHGSPGSNPFMVWDDYEEEMPVKNIGIASLEGTNEIASVQLAPPVDIDFIDPKQSYQKKYDEFKMPTSIIVVEPIRLQMQQMGSGLKVIDRLDNMSYNVGIAPGAGKTIPYRFTLNTDGSASYEQLNAGKETKQRLAMQKGAMVATGVANLIAMMAPGFSLGGPIGIAAGLALGAGGLAIGKKGFAMQAAVDYANMRDTEYVFQEDFVKRSPTGSEITPMMEQYKMRAYMEIEKTDLLDPSSLEGYQALMKAYQNIILYANNAYVADDMVIKEKLFQGLDQLMVYSGDKPLVIYNDLLNLFVSGYNNMYLIDKNSSIDMARRQQWALTISNLASELFRNANEEGVTFKGLFGLYLWFDKLLPADGRGYIEFEAKGLSDIMVAFSPEAFINMRTSNTELYELGFGVAGNMKFVIRNKSLAKTPIVVKTAAELKKTYLKTRPGFKGRKVPNMMATPQGFTKYAINIHDGLIAIWHNQPYEDQVPMFEWQDPYPLLGISSFGLSCWATPVTFRNVKIYPSLFAENANNSEIEEASEDVSPNQDVAVKSNALEEGNSLKVQTALPLSSKASMSKLMVQGQKKAVKKASSASKPIASRSSTEPLNNEPNSMFSDVADMASANLGRLKKR